MRFLPRIKFNPITVARWRRFRSIRRGYWSLIMIVFLVVIACFGELLMNSRALIVKYEGKLYFPTYGAFHPGLDFGLDYDYETNYRELKAKFEEEGSGNWVLMPPVPYNPYENDYRTGSYPPTPPSWETQHYLGTDSTGRDVLARLFYGFRIAIMAAMAFLFFTYFIGIIIGCLMGYLGGVFDILFQRFIEIWSNVPFLYIVIILSTLLTQSIFGLLMVMIAFSWMGITYYMRTATYKEKARTYVDAARTLGASTPRILFKHIIPNTISTVITFIPFSVTGLITGLTALDFLGFGLPPPTPSWGELLFQGKNNLHAPWIVSSVFVAMVFVLTLFSFIGEAIRESFDPKDYTTYE